MCSPRRPTSQHKGDIGHTLTPSAHTHTHTLAAGQTYRTQQIRKSLCTYLKVGVQLLRRRLRRTSRTHSLADDGSRRFAKPKQSIRKNEQVSKLRDKHLIENVIVEKKNILGEKLKEKRCGRTNEGLSTLWPTFIFV